MNKFLSLTIGCVVAAGSLGAIAVALPGAEPTISVQALPESLYLDGVANLTAKWDASVNQMVVSCVIPSSGYYYGDNWERQTYEFTTVDKVEISRADRSTGNYYAPYDLILTQENVAVGNYSVVDETAERGKKYSYQVKYYLGEFTQSYPPSSMAVEAGLFPGQVSEVSFITNKGEYPVIVTGTVPSMYKDGETEINEPVTITCYKQEYNTVTYTTERVDLVTLPNQQAGSKFQITLTEGLKVSELNSILFEATTADGTGDPFYSTLFFGLDSPAVPQNLKVSENTEGNIVLTWDAPDAPSRGGYFDPTTTRYRIELSENESYDTKVIANGLTECTYTYTPTVTQPTVLEFFVYAYNDVPAANNLSTSATIIAGPAEKLPFSETFSVKSGPYSWSPEHIWSFSTDQVTMYPSKWQYAESYYVNGTSVTGPDGNGGVAYYILYQYNNTLQNDCITTAKIDVDGEDELELSFAYYGVQGFTNILKAQVSFDGGDFTDAIVVKYKDLTETKWDTASGVVKVPAGTKFMNLRMVSCNGVADETIYPCTAMIDNIKLRSAGAPAVIYPASVTELTARYNETKNTIILDFAAPSKTHPTLGDVNGADLDYITKIEIYRQEGSNGESVLVHTIENPAPGAELSWEDTTLGEGGYYYYRVLTYLEDHCDAGVSLSQPVLVGQIPGQPTDFTAYTIKGEAPAYLAWTAPVVDYMGKELKTIKSMKLERIDQSIYSTVVVREYTEVTPGQKFTYEDYDIEKESSYQYRVTCVGTAGSGTFASVSVSTSADTPSQVQNVVATSNADGSITITWNPVTGGVSGGYIDLDDITYTVTRVFGADAYNSQDGVVVGEKITATEFTETEFTFAENNIKYFVSATSGGKTGSEGMSNVVFAGQPSQLPIIENFNTPNGYVVTSNNPWLLSSDNSMGGMWAYSYSSYVEGSMVYPVAEDGGLAYCYYGTYSSEVYENYLTSTHIALNGATPAVSFYYFGKPEYDSEIGVAVSFDNGDFNTIFNKCFRDVAEEGWVKVEFGIEVPEGAELMQVRFISHKGPQSCPVVIDDIVIYNLPAPVASQSKNNTLVWTVDETTHAQLAGFNIYRDADKANDEMFDTTADTFKIDSPEQDGEYTVTAVYNDGALESVKSNAVKLSSSGINGATAEYVSIMTKAGQIVVEGAADQLVTIHAVDGTTVYTGTGDCKVSLTPATYIVKVGALDAVKLFVR